MTLTAATELVTLTSGGNDVNYTEDLIMMSRRGSLLGTVLKIKDGAAKPAYQRAFAEFAQNLLAVLREVRRRSPRATIVVATYPAILLASGSCVTLGLTPSEAGQMRPVATRLADVTRQVAEAEGALVVDRNELGKDHNACSPEPWVNGAAPDHLNPGAPFHPTLQGAAATAQAIASQLRKL